MKQLLFLLIFPCLALAQYQGNANQKITLGEQTTADGLVWRGRLADTANLLTNKLDTSVYIVLDTGTRAMWYYRVSTTPKWTRLVDSLNNLQGTLSVAKGGTGSATQNFVDLTTTQSIGGAKTFTSAVTGASFKPTANDSAITGIFLPTSNIIGFSTNNIERMRLTDDGKLIIGTKNADVGGSVDGISLREDGRLNVANSSTAAANSFIYYGDRRGTNNEGAVFMFAMGGFFKGTIGVAGQNNASENSAITFNTISNNEIVTERMRINYLGRLGIGTSTPSEALHVVGNARISAMNNINDIGADANGVLQAATSDMNLKNTIENSPFGLNEILLLNPVTFLYNDENRKMDSDVKEVGFIAQDVFDVIPNAVSSTGTGDLQLDYRAITATLVKAIQEQQALIKALEQRILILENK